MTKQTIATAIISLAVSLGTTVTAQAANIVLNPTFDASNQTSPPDTTDYEGIFYDGSTTFPPASTTIGSFNFTPIPAGATVLGATISGTFGDVNFPVTALTDLFVLGGGIEVGACDLNPDSSFPACEAGTDDGSLVSWSHTFNSTELGELATDLASGSIDFTAVQNMPFGAIVVGSPTLDIQVTPEPSTLITLAGGLVALAAFRRRK